MKKKANEAKIPETVRSRMKDMGLKMTQARKSMLELLLYEHGPFSCEEVFEKLNKKKGVEPCDLVTVYRSLAKLEESGIIERCDFGDGKTRYEIKHRGHHHHHIICKVCKRVETITACKLVDTSSIPTSLGFKDVTHKLEFFGICPSCS